MLDFPLHPTLFISLAILVGFAISPLLAYVDNKSPIENNTSNANNLLNATWWLAAAFGISLLVIYNTKEAVEAKETVMALAPLGMMIAALIASASVMKNIAETKANEVKKHNKEESKFYLDKCIKSLSNVYTLLGDRQYDLFSWREAASLLISVKDLFKNITDKSHIKIFHEEYYEYSAKLCKSFFWDKNGIYSPIQPTSFCWNDNIDRDLNIVFDDSKIHISPQFILPVIDFAEIFQNDFLTNSLNYEDWRNHDLNKPVHSLLKACDVDTYINIYKEKIPEKSKDQQ